MIVSVLVLLACPAPAQAHPSARRPDCGRLHRHPRAELACGRRELRLARLAPPWHSRGFWEWRERRAHGWIVQARKALADPPAHSPYTPDPRAAAYWTRRYFGTGWQYRLMMCVGYRESRYELAATNGVNVGPWQVNLAAHPWVDGNLIRQSWRYAAAVSWHLSGYGTDFSAWHGDCGL